MNEGLSVGVKNARGPRLRSYDLVGSTSIVLLSDHPDLGLLPLRAVRFGGRDYYVESPSTPDRTTAETQLLRLPELSAGSTPRVIRRFRVGEGWAFVVRVDALNEDQSHRVAELLSVGEEAGVIYRRVGSRTIRVLETQQVEPEVVTSPAVTIVQPPDENELVAAMGREQENIEATEEPSPVAVKS